MGIAAETVSTAGETLATAGLADADIPDVVRTYNKKLQRQIIRLLPGGAYTTDEKNEVIVTVLGSCVSACIRNPFTGFGGMNHFMLPESEGCEWNGVSAALRYGNHAMESLINRVVGSGCKRQDLEIKLFGGADLYSGVNMIGQKNSEFAETYMKREGLPVKASDLGGSRARRIYYDPSTGRVKRLLLKANTDFKLLQKEHCYKVHLDDTPLKTGDVELFD